MSLKNRIFLLIFLCLSTLVFWVCRLVGDPLHFPAQAALRIECAREILQSYDTHRLYINTLIPDQPGAIYLQCLIQAPLMWLSNWWSISLANVLINWCLFLASLTALSFLCLSLNKDYEKGQPQYALPLAMALLGLGSVYCVGQSEYLLLLALLPYTVSRQQIMLGRKPGLLDEGLAVALGLTTICEYLFIPMVFLVEIALTLMHGRLARLSVFSTAVFTTVTANLAPLLIDWGSCTNFMHYVWPLIYADRAIPDIRTFGITSSPDSHLLFYLISATTIIALCFKRRSQYDLTGIWLMLAWCSFTYCLAELRGFDYQMLPVWWLTTMAAASMIDRFAKCNLSRYKLVTPQAFYGLTFCLASASIIVQMAVLHEKASRAPATMKSSYTKEAVDLIAYLQKNMLKGDKIMIFNDALAPSYPLIPAKGLINTSSAKWSFAPRILKLRSRDDRWPKAQNADIAAFYRDRIAKDIQINRPKVICITLCEDVEFYEHPKIKNLIDADYDRVALGAYYSENASPREYASFNSPFIIYRRRPEALDDKH